MSTLAAAATALAGALVALVWLPTHGAPEGATPDLDAELAALRAKEGVESTA